MKQLALAMIVALAACGGGSSSSVTVTGTVKGQPIVAAENTSGNVTFPGTTTIIGAIAITSKTGICTAAAANKEPNSLRSVIILVGTRTAGSTSNSPPTDPGTYTVTTSGSETKFAYVSVGQTDATCTTIDAQVAQATSGTVTLTKVSNGSYAGSFDVTLDSGDHITGTFDATNCAALNAYVNSKSGGCQ